MVTCSILNRVLQTLLETQDSFLIFSSGLWWAGTKSRYLKNRLHVVGLSGWWQGYILLCHKTIVTFTFRTILTKWYRFSTPLSKSSDRERVCVGSQNRILAIQLNNRINNAVIGLSLVYFLILVCDWLLSVS